MPESADARRARNINICLQGNNNNDSKLVPVYYHNYDFEFVTELEPDHEGWQENDDFHAEHSGGHSPPLTLTKDFAEEEWAKIQSALEACVEELLTHSNSLIDLGEIDFVPIRESQLLSVQLRHDESQVVNRHLGLLALPSIYQPNAPDEDINPRGDIVDSFRRLACSGCAAYSGRLYARLVPDAFKQEPRLLPFRLRVEIAFAFRIPDICAKVNNLPIRDPLVEARRHILSILCPRESVLPPHYHGNTDVPFLYATLQPAPPLPNHNAETAVQPADLRATLLPFQRRSVAWLLAREGKLISQAGEIVSKPFAQEQHDHPLFWETVMLDEDNEWWYNRWHGKLMDVRPELRESLGGLLAEEPGLGKTVECISLILLNPSAGRDPSTRIWDALARLHVRPIKVTHSLY